MVCLHCGSKEANGNQKEYLDYLMKENSELREENRKLRGVKEAASNVIDRFPEMLVANPDGGYEDGFKELRDSLRFRLDF